ncbi:MAG TPA: substrate-binding domain-containing protein, partial [Polyangiaceae bacterium]
GDSYHEHRYSIAMRRKGVGAWLLAMTLGCVACQDKSKPSASKIAAAERVIVGVSQCNLGEPWRVQMNADLARAAASYPTLKLVFKDAQNDSLRQRAQVEELLAQGMRLLIISPKEAAPLTKPVAEVFRQGVPVIVLDRALDGDAYTTFIGADNRRIGREAGIFAQKALGEQGNIVELKGLMTSTPAQQRHAGFIDGLDLPNHPKLKIVFEADMQWLEPNARREMDAALASQPAISLVYAHNDPGAHGAYLAAKAAGREREMKFVGIDALPQEGLRYVQEGVMDATFAYPTGGAEAIDWANRILAGERPPKQITLGTKRFTHDNVARGGDPLP